MTETDASPTIPIPPAPPAAPSLPVTSSTPVTAETPALSGESATPDTPVTVVAPVTASVPASPVYKALVLDDNFFNRDLFRIALESAGYTVKEIEDPVEGNELLKTETYHLMILDLHMPKLDGGAILNSVRAQPIHDKMHIVVVTAESHRATDDVDDMADFVMLKPINVMEFAAFARRLQDVVPTRARIS